MTKEYKIWKDNFPKKEDKKEKERVWDGGLSGTVNLRKLGPRLHKYYTPWDELPLSNETAKQRLRDHGFTWGWLKE